jgi:hypothetical protein
MGRNRGFNKIISSWAWNSWSFSPKRTLRCQTNQYQVRIFDGLTDLDETGPVQVAQSDNQVRKCNDYLLVLEELFGYAHTSDKLGLVDWMDTPNIRN